MFLCILIQGRRAEAECEIKYATAAEQFLGTAASLAENPTAGEIEEVVSEEHQGAVLKDEQPVDTNISKSREMTETPLTCLTVQPHRVLCGVRMK